MIEPALACLKLPSWAIDTVAFTIAFSIITFLHIVLGEILPNHLPFAKQRQRLYGQQQRFAPSSYRGRNPYAHCSEP
ncbi:hypothetical protein [Laceyella tengchongensis]